MEVKFCQLGKAVVGYEEHSGGGFAPVYYGVPLGLFSQAHEDLQCHQCNC